MHSIADMRLYGGISANKPEAYIARNRGVSVTKLKQHIARGVLQYHAGSIGIAIPKMEELSNHH